MYLCVAVPSTFSTIINFLVGTHLVTVLRVKVKSSMARSLPAENLLPQKVGSIIDYFQ